jgi:hypothetical protein
MIMEMRQRKETDQEESEKGFQLLRKVMQDNPQIEPTLWVVAMWSCIVNAYIGSGMSHELFCEQCEKTKNHYKKWWNEREI